MQEYIRLNRGALQLILRPKNYQAVVGALGAANRSYRVNLRRVLKELQLVEESESFIFIL